MGRIEAQAEALPQNALPEASLLAQQYLYLPRRNTVFEFLRGRDHANTERLFENNLQQAVELVFQEQDMTELESYYLALFSVLQVRNERRMQGFESRRDEREKSKLKLTEVIDFQSRLVTADKAFEQYGRLVADDKKDPTLRHPVRDWFVRMRMAGLEVGRSLPLHASTIGEEIIQKATVQVEARRVPGLVLNRTELRGMLVERGLSDPMVEVIAV